MPIHRVAKNSFLGRALPKLRRCMPEQARSSLPFSIGSDHALTELPKTRISGASLEQYKDSP
jgi:hypothetical protein